MTALLELRDLSAAYGRLPVLRGISLEVPEGAVVTVMGPNGAGKTTVLRAICGMVRTRGEVRLGGESLAGRGPEQVARRGVAHVPEGRGTFAEFTVEENLRLGAYARRDRDGIRRDERRCYAAFPRLAERRRQRAGSLSGGEQQMLAIARALMLRPRLLLLDEPSLGLAPVVTRELFRVLGEIRGEWSTTMLIVEQNANLVLELADHGYVLEAGEVAMSGDADTIRADEGVRRAYLGY